MTTGESSAAGTSCAATASPAADAPPRSKATTSTVIQTENSTKECDEDDAEETAAAREWPGCPLPRRRLRASPPAVNRWAMVERRGRGRTRSHAWRRRSITSDHPCPPTENEVDAVLTALGLIGVVALIAANGYFVAVEFAFVAARRSRFLEQAEEGDRRSKRAIDVHKRLSFMLSGAQLGITVTTLLVGFIAEPAIASVIEPALDGGRRARVGHLRDLADARADARDDGADGLRRTRTEEPGDRQAGTGRPVARAVDVAVHAARRARHPALRRRPRIGCSD